MTEWYIVKGFEGKPNDKLIAILKDKNMALKITVLLNSEFQRENPNDHKLPFVFTNHINGVLIADGEWALNDK